MRWGSTSFLTPPWDPAYINRPEKSVSHLDSREQQAGLDPTFLFHSYCILVHQSAFPASVPPTAKRMHRGEFAFLWSTAHTLSYSPIAADTANGVRMQLPIPYDRQALGRSLSFGVGFWVFFSLISVTMLQHRGLQLPCSPVALGVNCKCCFFHYFSPFPKYNSTCVYTHACMPSVTHTHVCLQRIFQTYPT